MDERNGNDLLDDIRNEFLKHGWAEHMLTDTMILKTLKDALDRLEKWEEVLPIFIKIEP